MLYVDAAFGVSVPVVAAGLVVGVAGPPLAALPAIRRATRLPLNEALATSGSATGGQGPLDALLRRVRVLPRSAQIGLRGVARRRGVAPPPWCRSRSPSQHCSRCSRSEPASRRPPRGWFDDNHFDLWVQPVASKPFDADAARLIASTDGVRDAQRWLSNAVRVDGHDAGAWGLPARPLMNTRISRGRWYSDAEAAGRARVAVLGPTIAKTLGKDVGDRSSSPPGAVR